MSIASRTSGALLAVAMASGCAHARDFHDPAERITHRTAYTLQEHEGRVDVDLVGEDIHDLGVGLGVSGGVTKRFELGTNVAHAAIGVLDASAKVNVLDHPVAGLGISAGVVYTNPIIVWALPKSLREQLGDVHVLVVPTVVHASFPVQRWLDLHLGVGYNHVAIIGRYDSASVLARGGLGARDFYFEPQAAFYAGRRVAFRLYAHLSAWASARENVAVEATLAPGVVAGVLSGEWERLPFSATSRYTGAIELRLGRTTHLQVAAIVGRFKPFPRPVVMPALQLYWRFGGPRAKERRDEYRTAEAARKAARDQRRSR
jgi:hypothetical protein